MARIAGVEVPNNKRVEIGLTYSYGIGRTTSNQILAKTGRTKTNARTRKGPAKTIANKKK